MLKRLLETQNQPLKKVTKMFTNHKLMRKWNAKYKYRKKEIRIENKNSNIGIENSTTR